MLKKEAVRKIIEARLAREALLRETHLPPTDDVLQQGQQDLDSLREKLPSMTQILVADVVSLEMEALAKAVGFKGIGRMKRLSGQLRNLALEYKSSSYELASELAELAKALREQSESGIKELEKEKKAKAKEKKSA